MSRRSLLWVALLVVLAVVAFAVWQRAGAVSAAGRLELAGDARSEVRTIRAPAVSYPTPDPAVGIPGVKASALRPAAVTAPRASRTPVVSGRLAAVHVSVGSRVETGQVVAQLDTAMLDLGVEQARTAAAKAHADADVLAATLDTIADNRRELADARQELEDARAELVDGRAQLAEQLAALEKLAKTPMPPGAVPPTAPPPGAQRVDPRTLIPELKAKLAQLDAGLVKMDAAEAKLDTGASELRDARSRVTDARELMGLLAEGREIAVSIAAARRAQATLRSPVSGVVVEARLPGTVAMVNAPIVRVRPDGPTLVDTYATGSQLAGVVVGTAAEADFDSNAAGPLPGRVSRIGEAAEFPPAPFPTGIVHMTRAVRVTIALDDGGWAPPGTPVDVTILTGPGR